ncbi:HAD family hydrolase [Gloeobacter violaceus]|uniref:Gll2828 protein n=1 Tax=Gloeobacter violaceus (strain ATCC 29082 / PCC 7421) TaxID=251221 RepID=Q7NCZ8_GLOVI|nr:HAD hydrolase-like protein [Gloeobacter violaceus]BAC90769.1 gll2828 [Gloeobacter violaceus PCC 7421]
MNIQGIFLDFDGVISGNSNELMIRWLHAYACRTAEGPVGLQTVRTVAKLASACTPRELLELFFHSFAIPGQIGEVQQAMHRETSTAVRIGDALAPLLAGCARQGIPVKVLSQRSATQGTFNQLHHVPGIERDMICSTRGLSKANPLCYRQVGEELGIDLGGWLMVDDSPYALRGAKLAGLQTAWIVTAGFHEADYRDYEGLIDLRLGSLAALLPLIDDRQAAA